jgi:hypothetical protein
MTVFGFFKQQILLFLKKKEAIRVLLLVLARHGGRPEVKREGPRSPAELVVEYRRVHA